MNSKWFGDSFDLVKRVLISAVHQAGFSVFVLPMFTHDSTEIENDFFHLINAKPFDKSIIPSINNCLFIDPDIGISKRNTKRHITFAQINEFCKNGFEIVMVYDQSFSRNGTQMIQMQEKLKHLNELGLSSFYYHSHANFLFASSKTELLKRVEDVLTKIGIPKSRIIYKN